MVDIIHDVHRTIRDSSDSLLHAFRRRLARKRLLQFDGNSVLVICYGNICRSPFAEAVLRLMLPAGFTVQSAGFVAPGRSAPADGVGAARRFGIDLARHCSQMVTSELVRAAALIVVMDPLQGRDLVDRFGASSDQILVLGDLDPVGIETRTVTDPILKSRDVYVDCYDRIDRCARELAKILRRGEVITTLRFTSPTAAQPT